jgi:hypothetical protein
MRCGVSGLAFAIATTAGAVDPLQLYDSLVALVPGLH